ncbi:unnamed protein product, partial [Symbiodinium sp. KB8]
RLQGQKRHLVNALPKQAQFWKIPYAISSDTKQEYDTSRELRSGKHDNEHEPTPSSAQLATVPKFNLPLKIPFLAHTAFKNNAQKRSQHKVDIGNPSHASATSFCSSIPELSNIKDMLPQAWKRLTFAKASRTLDHANAHLMICCPNVYNQAAFNTWMDEKTFLLLDKSPQVIKEDMERQTPPVVRKHYKKLLDYNKPIPYDYIMMKRKKQWSKGRTIGTIIAYSNTCVGRLLRVAALALQQMLKATWPHHFGNIATPQLRQEVHELFRANEEQPERELIFLNHDLVGFFNSIPQPDIIQSVRYLITEFSKNNNDILLIDP